MISSLSTITDSDRFTPAVFESSLSTIQILIDSHQSNFADIESVKLTDSDRFTPAVFDIESVNDTDSDRFTPADL